MAPLKWWSFHPFDSRVHGRTGSSLQRRNITMNKSQTPIQWLCLYLLQLSTFFFFCITRAWTLGLHLELLHQPFFVKGFFEIGSHGKIFAFYLMAEILQIGWDFRHEPPRSGYLSTFQ
jgi:hypothetical protein